MSLFSMHYDDDNDSNELISTTNNGSATATTTRIAGSCADESLAGMYYIADCDDDESNNPIRFDMGGVVAEKRGTGSTSESTTLNASITSINHHTNKPYPPSAKIVTPPTRRQLHQIEQEVLAKRQGRHRIGNSSNHNSKQKRTTTRKTATAGPSNVVDTVRNEDYIRKENELHNIPTELQRMEADLDDKLRRNKSMIQRQESSRRSRAADMLQSDIDAKQRFSQSRPFAISDEISRLDAHIAARNSKVRLASKRNIVQSIELSSRHTEQESIQTPIVSNVAGTATVRHLERNPDTTTMTSGVKREGSSAGVEQQYQSIKIEIDKDADNISNSALYQGSNLLDGGNTISYGLIPHSNLHDDLEYGVYDGPNDKRLAVAFMVEDDEDDMFIPSAVEFDPDAKPPTYKNRRFRLYACLAIIVVIVGTITASVGITLTQQQQQQHAMDGGTVPVEDLPYRATLGIRDSIERLVGGERLDDISSPYRKALDWIQDVDPLTLTPNDENFIQRYLAVYFFYATSIKHPWSGGCNPPVNDEDETCLYKRLSSLDPVTYTDIPWQRWLTKQFECNWAGIYCDDAGQIRSLEFSGINMTGTFPEGIVGFSFLQSMTLSFGELEGPLPEVLVDMKHLVNIELQGNLFTGTIPSAWYKSRSIQRINLSINQISGPISPEMSEVKDMKGIFMYENSLTGSLPTEIGLMRSLSFFRINRNFLQGSIPSTIGNLQLLFDIWIQRNTISGPIPSEFALLNDLTDFRAQGNFLSGPIPEEFYDMPSIRRVDMFENRLNGTISSSISKLSLLDQFRVNDNQLSGIIPTQMGSMTALASFVASGNKLIGLVPEKLCNLRLRDFGSYFIELQTDCSVPKNGVAEILCPQGCCTHCCDANGTACVPNA